MNPSILITGAGGYVGLFLVNRLMQTREFNLNLSFEDVTSSKLMLPHADVIIHLAAKLNSSKASAEETMEINYEGTVNVVRQCPLNSHVIFLSSDLVFSSNPTRMYNEADSTCAETVYGRSKALAEDFLTANHPHSTILRAAMLYGYQHPRRMNFFRYLDTRLAAREHIQLYNNVFGRLTFVDDLCRVIKRVIQERICGVYHVCGDEYLSRYQLGLKYCHARHHDSALIVDIPKPPEVNIPNYLNLRPSSIFRHELSTDLESGIDLMDAFRMN